MGGYNASPDLDPICGGKSVPRSTGIYAVLILYLLLASVYSIVTPVMEASDELWHYPMVKHIADRWSLPVQDPANVGLWRQEGSQPPLYYLVGAILTSWIDTSDLDQVRWLNPHADNGIIRQDGNTNLILHTSAEQFPWRGTALAIHLIRFLSVAMGAGTVYLTYSLVLDIWPARTGLALAAAAVTGSNPMFCFISGSVNNDNLAMLLGAAGIWLLVRLLRVHSGGEPRLSQGWWRDLVVLGLVQGAGVLTKTSVAGLLPLTALTIGYVAWRQRSWRHLLSGGVVTAGLVVAVSGWWFVRNAVLYDGDWLGLEQFVLILGYRVPPATLHQLWGERHGFMMAYWGLFGGVNVPMPLWTYAALNTLTIAALGGLVLGAARHVLRAWRRADPPPPWPSERAAQIALLGLWPAVVLVSWAGWAMRTWSSQGRLIFTAISAWSTWLVLGLSQLLPRRWSSLLPGAMAAFLFGLAAWAPFGVIAPAYRPPILPPTTDPEPEHVLRADMGGQLRLLGYDIERTSARPGEAVRFTLYWEAQRKMDRNWSIFCHVLDAELEAPIAVRDRYPAQGLLPTSTMDPGLRWADRYAVWLPETAFAPSESLLEIGLYDGAERVPIVIEDGVGQVVDNALRFQPLRIEPRPGDVPNAVWISFGDQMALTGWHVDRRMAAPGETLTLTLYWECLESMDRSYTVSAQLLNRTGGKSAQVDAWPGNLDTRSWEVGEQVVDRRELSIGADAQPEVQQILIGVYWIDASGELKRLRIINEEGRVLPQDSWVLGQVRVIR